MLAATNEILQLGQARFQCFDPLIALVHFLLQRLHRSQRDACHIGGRDKVVRVAEPERGMEIFGDGTQVTILGAGVGALSGFLIGRSGKKRVLIYEAR